MTNPGEIARSSTRLELLDPLRGIAALWVMLYHFQLDDRWQAVIPGLPNFAKAGYYGVELFFVISGYCIVGAAAKCQQRGERWTEFLWRRLVRIYPPFWYSVALVVALPYLQYCAKSVAGGATWPQPLFTALSPMDWFAMLTLVGQGYRHALMPLNEKFELLNVVYWTLALEVQFYLIVAASLWAGARWGWYLAATTLLALPVAWYGLPAGWNTGLCLPYWPQFICGGVVWWLQARQWTAARIHPQWGQWWGAVLSLALVMVGMWTLGQGGRFHSVTFSLGVATALWGVLDWNGMFAARSGVMNWVLWPWRWLGAMSYSIYLIHFNLGKAPRLLLPARLFEDVRVYETMVVVCTLLLVTPFYWWCDRPYAQGRSDGFVLWCGQVMARCRPGASRTITPVVDTTR